MNYLSIFSLLTFLLGDIFIYYLMSSLLDGMMIFIKKAGLRFRINTFQVGQIIKSKGESLSLWDFHQIDSK